MKSICVFCGSSEGRLSTYKEQAHQLGQLMGERGWRLVYGGGSMGVMGAVAQSTVDHGGHVLGVIPKALHSKRILSVLEES